MASVLSTLVTAEEFFDFANRTENRDRHFELEEGEVIELPQPGERHGVVCGNGVGMLWTNTRAKKKGYVCSNDTGIVLQREPDTVRGPDISVYLEPRKFNELAVKYPERMPSLIVDVISPSDRHGKMLKRMKKFIEKGVAMAWLIDPDEQTVMIFLPNQSPTVLEGDEEVTGQDVLPDFRCKASDFFVMPGE